MIYFITARSVGMVKIGHAKNPQTRAVAIRCHSPVAIELERVGVGGREEERELHKRFSHLRERGEWFRLDQSLERLMQSYERHEWHYRNGDGPRAEPTDVVPFNAAYNEAWLDAYAKLSAGGTVHPGDVERLLGKAA